MIIADAVGLKWIGRGDRQRSVGINRRQRRARTAGRRGLAHGHRGARNRVPRRPEHDVVFSRSLRACWNGPAGQRHDRKYESEYCSFYYVHRAIFLFTPVHRFHSVRRVSNLSATCRIDSKSVASPWGTQSLNPIVTRSGAIAPLPHLKPRAAPRSARRMVEFFASNKHQSYFQTRPAPRLKLRPNCSRSTKNR